MSFVSMPLLTPDDRVNVVAPSGPFVKEWFDAGVATLSARYRVQVADEAFGSFRYLAGDDLSRGAALQRALGDSTVKAIVAARGGYGAMRLLPALRFAEPHTLLGFSDITALHAAWQARDWRSVHGPVITQLARQPADVIARTFDCLEGRPVAPLEGTWCVRPGEARGPLMGGNLSLLSSLVGTPFMPSLRGAVLLLEDVGERPYRLDRLWTQLRLSNALDGVVGIALGEFTECEEKGASFSSAEVLNSLTHELNVPVLAGLPIGHGAINQPVVLGARVLLDATHKRLEHLEGLA